MSTRTTTSAALLALAIALATPACLSLGGDDAPAIRRHSIDLPPIAVAEARTDFPSIVVRQFASRGRYVQRVVTEDEPGRVAYLELDRWVEDPAEAMTTVVRETLAASGRFDAVATATSEMETELVLEGTLLACDVMRPEDGPWRARLALRLEVTARSTGNLVHAAAFESERRLPGASTDGLGAAMGACARDIMTRAIAAWGPSRESR